MDWHALREQLKTKNYLAVESQWRAAMSLHASIFGLNQHNQSGAFHCGSCRHKVRQDLIKHYAEGTDI